MPRRRALLLVPVLLAFLVGAFARADDVPDDARSFYDAARKAMAAGDAKAAYSAISKGRLKEPLSVDFWVLYVRIWRALEKPEDVLWERMVGKVAEKHEDSPVFDLVHARLATDPDERLSWLRKAAEHDPSDVGPRLLLAQALLDRDEQMEAEELLDQILETSPDEARALAMKGDLLILQGLERSALDLAEESLQRVPHPALHDLAARALLRIAANDASVLDQAREHAAAAAQAGGEGRYVLTLARVLDAQGKPAEARKALRDALERSSSDEVAVFLGWLDLREGDYAAAIPGLALGTDPGALLGLAVAHARLGHAKEAGPVIDAYLAAGGDAVMAARLDFLLGEPERARTRVEGLDSDPATYVRVLAQAAAGRVAEVEALLPEEAASGSRAGESWLIPLVRARLAAALGAKAAAVRHALLEARWKAAAAGTPPPVVPDSEPSVAGRSFGYMHRYVTYRRCLSGSWFTPEDTLPIAPTMIDGQPAIGTGVVATSDCARDAMRVFVFNAQKIEGNVTITIDPQDAVWDAASTAFAAGCAALRTGDAAAADAAFGQALEQEPTWGRAMVLRGAAKALAGDAAGGAALAREAVAHLPDDTVGREVGILVRRLAGEDVAAEVAEIGRIDESFAPRRLEEMR